MAAYSSGLGGSSNHQGGRTVRSLPPALGLDDRHQLGPPAAARRLAAVAEVDDVAVVRVRGARVDLVATDVRQGDLAAGEVGGDDALHLHDGGATRLRSMSSKVKLMSSAMLSWKLLPA